MKKLIIAIAAILLLGGCKNGTESQSGTSAETTVQTETTEITTAVTKETTAETSETTSKLNNEVTSFQSTNDNNIMQFLNEIVRSYVLFCDIDLDGNAELLIATVDDRSFSTNVFSIYKLNDEIPTLYGRIDLESSQSRYTENTICGGKLQRYYDSEKGVYVIISDATKWDDGSFGNVQYYINMYTLYSDKIKFDCLDEFSGTSCRPAELIRNASSSDSWYVYDRKVIDLGGTEKFLEIPDILQEYEFTDTIDLESLEKYKDIDKIMELVCKYSGYENTNNVLAPDKKYIGITGVSNHEICTNDTEVYIEIKDIDELDWNKLCEIEDLHEFVLHYFGEDEIDIDLSPLKKYYNLTSISLWGNISKNTKRQISEFSNLEYVDMWDIMISSEEDFEYVRNLPKLRYIAVTSDNDDPDYFKFLYDNNSIKWIRFDDSVTNEQIKQVVDNMPNLEAVTFGFSEV